MATKEKAEAKEAEAPKFATVKPHAWTDARAAILAIEDMEKKPSKAELKVLLETGFAAADEYLNPNGIALGKELNSVPEVANCRAFRAECKEALKKLK